MCIYMKIMIIVEKIHLIGYFSEIFKPKYSIYYVQMNNNRYLKSIIKIFYENSNLILVRFLNQRPRKLKVYLSRDIHL